MPSQCTSELPSMRTTYPHTHQISLELEVPICQTSPPPMAQTRCLQAPLPRTSGSSPTHATRSEEHTSELQSLMRISYAVFCLKNKMKNSPNNTKTKNKQ